MLDKEVEIQDRTVRGLSGILLCSIFCIGILISFTKLQAQNLVNNCSFESFSSCPTEYGQIDRCKQWYSPGEGTTDYCNQCGTIDCDVPNNLWGSQYAFDGAAYAHIICYYPQQNQWEYVQTKLACDLNPGEVYSVSFKVSCADYGKFAIDGMGLHFTADSLLQENMNIITLPTSPHISNLPGNILDDKVGWMEISGQYTASGDEKYITIGNFIETPNLQIHSFSGSTLRRASYYIDDVKITPVTPWLNLGNDTIICPGDTIQFDATIPCATSYSWNNGVVGPTMFVSTPGSYQVEVEIGCSSIYDEIEVINEQTTDITLPNDTSICIGADITLNAGSGFLNYLWQDSSHNQYYTGDKAGLYWVEVEDVTGCIIKDSVEIGSITTPAFSLIEDSTLCYDNSITLEANITGLYLEYLWNDNSTEQELFVSDSGIYWLEVSNPCGFDIDSVNIHYRNCNANIYVPNAFTPNHDGINDTFNPKGVNIDEFKMYIFDRWGKMLFESNSIYDGWDGSYKGNQCSLGTYVWIIQYSGQSDQSHKITETLRGTVTLLR